jgi:hypothetical protein
MANDHNLRPAKKGEVRNPKGRGKGVPNRATVLKELAEINLKGQDLNGTERTMTAYELMNVRLFLNALGGDLASIKEVQDTLHGKIADRIIDESATKTLVMIVTDKDIDDPPDDPPSE